MATPLNDIPEVTRPSAGEGLVRLPYGQDVPFTPRVRAIVDTAAFQRLRHISQLGLATTVYPGATHTRFEHALGVFSNGLRYVAQLDRDPRFAEVMDGHTANVLLCAALLHDVGHWPFCHPLEDLELSELPSHEAFAADILRDDQELADVLDNHWNVRPNEVWDILEGSGGPAGLRLARSILSGPIDIDKLDYLERDSLHAGVPYGRNLDKNRLIASLMLNEAGDGLAISAKGKTAAELMVFARYVMFSEVYWHHTVRGATAMFTRAFYESRRTLNLNQFLRGTDAASIAALCKATQETPWEKLTNGLFGPLRQIYKQVAEWGALNAPEVYDAIAQRPYPQLIELAGTVGNWLARKTGTEIAPGDVLIDAPPPGREVEFRVEIFDPAARTYQPLAGVSPVVEALAKRQFDDAVKRVRVFVHPRLRPQVDEIPDLAKNVNRIARGL